MQDKNEEKDGENRKQLNIRLNPELMTELKILAIRNGMKFNCYIQRILLKHVIKQKQYE